MKNSKKIIVCIILIILIIIDILIALIKIDKKDKNQEIEKNIKQETIIDSPIVNETTKLEIGKSEYLEICKCLNNYINEIYTNKSTYYSYDNEGNYKKTVSDQEINKNIYGVLSDDYIKKNSITIDNVRDYIYKLENNSFYVPIEIHKKVENNFLSTYVVYGVIGDILNNPITESYLILNIDNANRTYSVESLGNIDNIENIEVPILEKVENKGNNILIGGNIASIDETIITTYLSMYKKVALTYPEIAYNYLLDDEYKQKKFGTVDNYKKYVNDNKNSIVGINIKKYDAIVRDGYTQYVGIDQNEKSYFFNATSANEYKVILDYYTVDVPQFTEKYNVASDTEKIAYNVQKCLDAINGDDYSYMYSKLSENFKNNYYPTENHFKQAMMQKLFDKNTITDISTNLEGDVYDCEVTISNKDNLNEFKKITIIMQLREGTDFVMSFNVD